MKAIFVETSLKRIFLYLATLQLLLVMLTPVLHVMLGSGAFDFQFLSVYIIFIILLPLISLYQLSKQLSVVHPRLKRSLVIELTSIIDLDGKVKQLLQEENWRLLTKKDNHYII